ncbi:MAG: Modulator of FtsH protease HflK [Paracidovorax wautersii]|uniref:Protein HflK n=1 Tax=Paracidovorax wautersii TaxID=1177982 RepID=A0A7V8FQW9_9BURK|nr:MAG: Modulator of FtsH protease HflK [Paracidovorax wautersii]
MMFRLMSLPARIRGMFNLNDPRWGRGEDNQDASGPRQQDPSPDNRPSDNNRPSDPYGQGGSRRPQGSNQGPPDMDEIWRNFNSKLNGLFGGGNGQRPPGRPNFGGGSPRSAGIGAGLIAGVAVVIWLATGFFIVQEGQQAVVTQFGRYQSTVGAGFNWRLPYPFQQHEIVNATQLRSVDVGGDTLIRATGLRTSALLTEDENIVEIKFVVQYRLKDVRSFLFESRDPEAAVVQAAESAVREVVGKMKMDSAMAEERDQIAGRVRELMQTILDRYKTGIEVAAVNMQQGGVRPPEQVQAAFDDVLSAGQERERLQNEARAYANNVIPRAQGTAARLREEAEAYKARVVAQAEGDAQRFNSVFAEYQRAPQVTRDRMYTDAMQEVYKNVSKVLVDTRQNSNLLYLPLDKLMQQAGKAPTAANGVDDAAAAIGGSSSGASAAPSSGSASASSRLRDDSRQRESR